MLDIVFGDLTDGINLLIWLDLEKTQDFGFFSYVDKAKIIYLE